MLIFGIFGFQNALIAQNTVSLYLIDKGWNLDTNIIELRATHFQRVGTMHFSLKEINNQGDFAGVDQIQLMNFQPGVNFSYHSILITNSVNLVCFFCKWLQYTRWTIGISDTLEIQSDFISLL